VFAIELVVHVASFSPGARITVSHAFLFWLASVGAFGFMFSVPDNPLLKRKGGERPKVSQREMWAVLPGWLRSALVVLAAYMAIASTAGVFALRNGGPSESDGQYWAENRKLGVAAHPITATEYWRLESHEVRLVTSLGALVASLPIVVLVWHARRERGAG
jgi:hypothetical protein